MMRPRYRMQYTIKTTFIALGALLTYMLTSVAVAISFKNWMDHTPHYHAWMFSTLACLFVGPYLIKTLIDKTINSIGREDGN